MITRGSTPTIEFSFKTVSPKDMETAYLTIKQNSFTKIEKDISQATVNDTTISWELTQEETLRINKKFKCEIQMRYRLTNGFADASPTYEEDIYNILKAGVI